MTDARGARTARSSSQLPESVHGISFPMSQSGRHIARGCPRFRFSLATSNGRGIHQDQP